MFDVVKVEYLREPSRVTVIARDKDARNAEAVVSLAVMRQGVNGQFFAVVAPDRYRDGDEWLGNGVAE